MKVIAFNGSPNQKGNTHIALGKVIAELEKEGISVEEIHVGNKLLPGCVACGRCKTTGLCKFDDEVNGWVEKMKEADGILLGSPVHFSGIPGTMKAFLDRAMYTISADSSLPLRFKVGAGVVAVRRSGGVAVVDQLNHFLTYHQMTLATSCYWSVTHGMVPGEAEGDEEGNQILRVLGKNMAWLLKAMELGRKNIALPEGEERVRMNFIR